MIALQPLACGGALPVELKAFAREQRELTNPASAGNCVGEALRTRCLDRLGLGLGQAARAQGGIVHPISP